MRERCDSYFAQSVSARHLWRTQGSASSNCLNVLTIEPTIKFNLVEPDLGSGQFEEGYPPFLNETTDVPFRACKAVSRPWDIPELARRRFQIGSVTLGRDLWDGPSSIHETTPSARWRRSFD